MAGFLAIILSARPRFDGYDTDGAKKGDVTTGDRGRGRNETAERTIPVLVE